MRHEDTFRQGALIKGRNRDTGWYSVTDVEWLRVRRAFVNWLSPDNFDNEGMQRAPLQARASVPGGSRSGAWLNPETQSRANRDGPPCL